MGRRVLLTYQGQTRSQTDWARHLGIDPRTLHYRLAQGMPLAQALVAEVHTHDMEPRPCRWCSLHERGLVVEMDGSSSWHPLPRGMLWLALRIARGSGCAGQIRVVVTKCDLCAKEK